MWWFLCCSTNARDANAVDHESFRDVAVNRSVVVVLLKYIGFQLLNILNSYFSYLIRFISIKKMNRQNKIIKDKSHVSLSNIYVK